MSGTQCEDIRPTSSLHWGDIVTIVVYFIFVLLVGVWVSGLDNGKFEWPWWPDHMHAKVCCAALTHQMQREYLRGCECFVGLFTYSCIQPSPGSVCVTFEAVLNVCIISFLRHTGAQTGCMKEFGARLSVLESASTNFSPCLGHRNPCVCLSAF